MRKQLTIIASLWCLVANVYSDLPFFLHKSIGFREANLKVNRSVDACQDFYAHSCDVWRHQNPKPNSEPLWNQYLSTSYTILFRIQHILSGFEGNAKVFYSACIDDGNDYTEQFRLYLEKLGGWNQNDKPIRVYNHLEHIAEVGKLLGLKIIFSFHVDVDFTDASKQILYIGPGNFAFPEIYLLEPEKYRAQLSLYETWIGNSIGSVFGLSGEALGNSARDVVNFEVALARIAASGDKKVKMSGEQMRNVTGNMHWIGVLFAHDFPAMIVAPNYLRKALKLLSTTKQSTVSNYIIWSIVKGLGREISPALRNFSFSVDKEVLEISEDLSRENECAQNTLKYFSHALFKPYIRTHFDARIFAKVYRMAKNIKVEFLKMLLANQWLGNEMKASMVGKIAAVKFEIGFPKFYSDEHIDKTILNDNHFENTLKLKFVQTRLELEQINKPVKSIKWPNHPFEVNAYYSTLQNAIILPLGILTEPFYDPKRSVVGNYAALGSLIGHELSHALDSVGTKMDKTTAEVYRGKNMCFRTLYTAHGFDDGFSYGENVADNVGLDLSFRALRTLVHGSVESRKNFFVNFAQMWCEYQKKYDFMQSEEHAPVNVRVTATVANSPDFQDTFNCAKKEKKCKLW